MFLLGGVTPNGTEQAHPGLEQFVTHQGEAGVRNKEPFTNISVPQDLHDVGSHSALQLRKLR